eukprot:PLAT7983.1.p1 GENE.PLAT7983.1~~PLAT7983.1.p1  ORF type:complete len:570 (-),score=250.07 PLAT7983.1:67-1527(-)
MEVVEEEDESEEEADDLDLAPEAGLVGDDDSEEARAPPGEAPLDAIFSPRNTVAWNALAGRRKLPKPAEVEADDGDKEEEEDEEDDWAASFGSITLTVKPPTFDGDSDDGDAADGDPSGVGLLSDSDVEDGLLSDDDERVVLPGEEMDGGSGADAGESDGAGADEHAGDASKEADEQEAGDEEADKEQPAPSLLSRLFSCFSHPTARQPAKDADEGVAGAEAEGEGEDEEDEEARSIAVDRELTTELMVRRADLLLDPLFLARGAGQALKTIVFELDETLVYSSFEPVEKPDYIVPVMIDDHVYYIYVQLRPGLQRLLQMIAPMYEIVVWTASLAKYSDPLLNALDVERVISARIFREDCSWFKGTYVRDIVRLDRPLDEVFIVLADVGAVLTEHRRNFCQLTPYAGDATDTELFYLADFLVEVADCDDVRLHSWKWRNRLRAVLDSLAVDKRMHPERYAAGADEQLDGWGERSEAAEEEEGEATS